MMRRPRLLALLASVTLAAALAPATADAGAAEAGPRPPGPAVPALDWQPCGPDRPGVDCATAVVPLDYDRPRGRTTTLALARVAATDPAHRIGTVFVNPGGPGGSGVQLVADGFGAALEAQLDGRFDVVGFDPRGVGASDPLHCFASAEDAAAFFAGLPVFPYREPQYRPYFRTARALGPACHDDGEAIVDHMSTADVVRDLDLLRRAVGDRRLTYLGFSYGTYIGNTYANLFPGHVRALVVDGVLDPRLWSSGRQIRSDRVDTAREFAEFLRLCDAAGAQCALGAGPVSARGRWERLATALRREPLDLGDGTQYTYDLLIAEAGVAMYSPSFWGGPDGWGAYFDAVADAVLGDATPATLTARRAGLLDALAPASAAAEPDYDNGLEAYYGNQCADTQYPSTLAAFRAVDRYAARGSRFGPFWWWGNAGCAGWPVNPDRYTGPWSTRTSAPVLVVGNYFDGVTGYRGAQATARLLRGSRLLTYAGWGHTAYGVSQCVRDHVDDYLVTGALPARGTVCPANPNPFVAAAARSSAPALDQVGRPPAWLLGR